MPKLKRFSVALVTIIMLAGIGSSSLSLAQETPAPAAPPVVSTTESPAVTAPVPVTSEVTKEPVRITEFVPIKNARVSDIVNLVRVSFPSMEVTGDMRSNLMILSGTRGQVDLAKSLIAAVDIALETAIIPVKYADATDLVRMVTRAGSSGGTMTVDTRTNSIIVTDTQSNVEAIKKVVAQLEDALKNRTQLGLDCSVVTLDLDEKHSAGIDWATCPYLSKDNPESFVSLKNVDIQKLMEWLSKFGKADLLSRKRVNVTPNEEVRFRDGLRYQYTEKQSVSNGTTGYMMTVRGEDAGFLYRFVAKKADFEGKPNVILTYNVDGVIPIKGSTVAYSVSINNAQVESGTTMVNEDIRRIMVVDESNPQENAKYDNLNIILLITPYSGPVKLVK